MFRELIERNIDLTVSCYFRLFFAAVFELCATIPVSCVYIYITYKNKDNMYPYKGLGDLHLDYNVIHQYPLATWTRFPSLVREFARSDATWAGCALAYFLIFGLTQEARNHYANATLSVLRTLHLKKHTSGTRQTVM